MAFNQNKIFIIGSGAIGKALAVFLKLAERNVMLIRGSIDDGSRKTEIVRVETSDGALHEADIEITTLSNFQSLDGMVVLTNKSYGNQELAKTLKDKTAGSPIVLLQNGLGVERPFINYGFPEIYRSVLFVTSQPLDTWSVRFKPVAICPIGVEKGSADKLDNIVEQLNTPDFRFKSEQDIQQTIWKKAIVNSVFNSVCPLLEVDNGIFHRDESAFQIARGVISECISIAGDQGVLIDAEQVETSLLQISRSSDGQLISTLQDIRNGRRTEIDTLNFEIVRIAERIGNAVPKTSLLGELTRVKASLNMRTIR